MPTLTLLIGLFSLAVGVAVLWANPPRFLNQTFFAGALIQAFWLLCVYGAMQAGARGATSNLEFWLRLNAAVQAFSPLCLWLIKESVNSPRCPRLIPRSLSWLSGGIIIAALAYSPWFIAPRSESGRYDRGIAYYIASLVALIAFSAVVADTIRQMQRASGIRRIETQFLGLNLGVGAIAVILLNALGNFLTIGGLKRLGIFTVFLAYASAAWAIAAYRIFDVRQVFTSIAQRLALILILAGGIAITSAKLSPLMPPPAAIALSAAIFCLLVLWLDRQSRHWFDLDGEHQLRKARRAFADIAIKESQPEQLAQRFIALLSTQSQTDHAALLVEEDTEFVSAEGLEFPKSRPAYSALCELGWATPESLERRRSDPALADLLRYLTDHHLGLLLTSPRGSQQPSLILALGVKHHAWPFTYPEVRRLQAIAELIDNSLTRSRLATQVVAQAKMEHLAMMSRGLAHDLRNLITPISSFLIHTDGRFSPDTPEADVHAAARRSVRVMTDYVREALFFSERLNLNFEPIDLPALFAAVRDLVLARASQRGVMIALAPQYPGPLIADAVLLQRLLTNLLTNAIDASQRGQIVTLSATRTDAGPVRLQIVDAGEGVAPENLSRIFDAYFTTKQFGEDVRGFGLGLTICQKIVDLHAGSISVSSVLGRGATFTVDLPASPAAAHPAPALPDPSLPPVHALSRTSASDPF